MEIVFKNSFDGYDLKKVFNMDETGFFFHALLHSTLSHVKQGWKTRKGWDHSGPNMFCTG